MAPCAAALAAGCGLPSEGPGDGGPSDAWECPGPIAASCADGGNQTIPVLFQASEFGEGTRFVDVAPWAVLAQRDAGGTRTISIIACGWWGLPCTAKNARVAGIDVPVDSGPHAIALATGYFSADSLSHVAALCDDATCALYGAALTGDVPDTEISAIAGGELPSALVRGLWWSDLGSPLCAYGDGIHCFDGTTWSSPVPTSAAPFNDVDTVLVDYVLQAIAVGDDGLIARSAFPSWIGERTGSGDWYAVATHDDGYAIAGQGGALAVQAGGSWHDGCFLGSEDVVVLAGSSRSSTGVTVSGRVFVAAGPVTAMEDACFTGQIVGANPRAAAFDCGLTANLFLMDATAVYGAPDCAVE
jgi:hypothetical protein